MDVAPQRYVKWLETCDSQKAAQRIEVMGYELIWSKQLCKMSLLFELCCHAQYCYVAMCIHRQNTVARCVPIVILNEHKKKSTVQFSSYTGSESSGKCEHLPLLCIQFPFINCLFAFCWVICIVYLNFGHYKSIYRVQIS